MTPRFLSIADVCEQLNLSAATVRSMLRSGELRGIQMGGKRTWRVSSQELEDYIQREFAATQERVAQNQEEFTRN